MPHTFLPDKRTTRTYLWNFPIENWAKNGLKLIVTIGAPGSAPELVFARGYRGNTPKDERDLKICNCNL